jgi:RimJ/RimL family protein N-acetyltransferase
MLHFRTFLNTYPPSVVRIWQQQLPILGQIETLTTLQCENNIFAKPYFDPAGFILAFDDDGTTPLGFTHAGFSKNDDSNDLDYSQGIVSMLKIVDGPQADKVADELLRLACEYLKSKGATSVHAGNHFPHAPFYRGIYGGSTVPGVIESDVNFLKAATRANFKKTDRIVVAQRTLSGFRPISGREQMAIRRKYQVNSVNDPAPKNWWENCVYGMARRERFSIFNKRDQVVSGDISFWDMKPIYATGVRARGAYNLNVPPEFRRSGIATFLLGDALKSLMQEGIELVEAQTRESDSAACGVFEKVGFEKKYHGVLLSKPI